MNLDYTKILLSKFPGSVWTLDGDEYEGLTWLSETDKPTQAELEAYWPEVKAELEATKEAAILKRSQALAKLEALGLDEDDLKALGL